MAVCPGRLLSSQDLMSPAQMAVCASDREDFRDDSVAHPGNRCCWGGGVGAPAVEQNRWTPSSSCSLGLCCCADADCTFSTELRVEVEQPPHQVPREGGSSSEYSSSSSSPMGVQAREESSDSAEESDRRKPPAPATLARPGRVRH